MPKGGRIVSALEQLKREADYLKWVEGTKAVTPEGDPLTLYHGTNRLDRLVDKIRPERSTSGPMPFFTADPEIASNYASNKGDNSIEDAGYEHWFQYQGKGDRQPGALDRLWWQMTPEQQKTFHERMPNIREDDEREHVFHDPEGGMAVPGTYETYLREQRGNGLAAARELWLSSGALFGGDEHKFMKVLQEAGAPMEGVSFTDMNHGAPGVMPAHISTKNPLVTSEIPPHVIEALEDAAARTRKPVAKYGADPWDKATRDPDEWMNALKRDQEEGTQLAWTSIPDFATRTLKALGYDSIHDIGGKMGGVKHDVWVPFDPEQVRSSITKKARGGAVRFAKGGKIKAPRTAMDELKEYANALAPQRGMFSTLDELVQQAPFEKGSAEQWQGFLKPGRMLKREGMEFPLKQEELDYALQNILKQSEELYPGGTTKNDILNAMRARRPEFAQTWGVPGEHPEWRDTSPEETARSYETYAKYGPDRDPRLSHQSPGSQYEEAITRLGGLNHPNHFEPDAMSWARTSSHALPSGEKMRLIEEIQSDLHHSAAEKGDDKNWPDLVTPEEKTRLEELQTEISRGGDFRTDSPERVAELQPLRDERDRLIEGVKKRIPRRGYRTPEDDAELSRLRAAGTPHANSDLSERAANQVPDAPFKDPSEYALLEIKKQLLNAAHNDEDYLALINPIDNAKRYGRDEPNELEETLYGKAGQSLLRKLGKKYGAEMTEVEAPVGSSKDTRPEWMQNADLETAEDFAREFREDNANGVEPQTMDEEKILDLRDVISKIDPNNRELIRDYNEFRQDHRHPGYDDGDLQSRWNNMVDHLASELGNQLDEGTHVTTPAKKKFPAIKLTPEVREKIKKAGVSLWATGAGAVGLEMLGHPDDASAEEAGNTTGGGFAEGGFTTGSDDENDFGESKSSSSLSDLKDLVKHFGLGFSTQWGGLDAKGRAQAPIYSDWDAPKSEWQFNPEAGMDLPPQKAVRPGMVDDLASLPELASTLGTLGHYKGPQWSQDAGKRSQALDEALRQQMGVAPPEGVLQHAAEAAGTMTAQIPAAFEGAASGVSKYVPKIAKKVLGPIAEWFSPTIKPTLKNYAFGTAAGTALTMTIPKVIEKLDEIRNSNDPWRLAAAAAKSGELPPELAYKIAQHLDPHEEVDEDHEPADNEEFVNSFLGE